MSKRYQWHILIWVLVALYITYPLSAHFASHATQGLLFVIGAFVMLLQPVWILLHLLSTWSVQNTFVSS
jgi:hypothetical protein